MGNLYVHCVVGDGIETIPPTVAKVVPTPPRNQQATMKRSTEWKKIPAGEVCACVVGTKQHMSYAMVTGVS
jgi:hypothetical protein